MKKYRFLDFKQEQDLRSLAAFRFFAGCYLLYDIVSRLQHGRLSLLWYTSFPPENSFLHPNDTPHRSLIHRIWFYRGSEFNQIILFTMTFFLGMMFTLGYKCNTTMKIMLWMNVVAMQCRCMPPHDGSDTFFRHLLLWSIQLPVAEVWSLDAVSKPRRPVQRNPCDVQNYVAVYGMRLQIVFMYLGTVLSRTVDKYGFKNMLKSPWLPPQLTAVHFALNSSFANRDFWLGDFVRTNLPLSQVMTLLSMITETFGPLACLLFRCEYVYIPAFILWNLHFGLLIFMNLPNWQVIGMLTNALWIPSWVWDSLQRRITVRFPALCVFPAFISEYELRKKDVANDPKEKGGRKQILGQIISTFFLTYMILDFAGNRGVISKFDSGDIGELLRFSQYWVMFSGPPKITSHALLTGNLNNDSNINVWGWMRNVNEVETVDIASLENHVWTNMTHVYPSPRVERAFSDWSQEMKTQQMEHFLSSMCHISPFDELTLIIQSLQIRPPNDGSQLRFSKRRSDAYLTKKCLK